VMLRQLAHKCGKRFINEALRFPGVIRRRHWLVLP
jgi:hypothetical protein